MKIDNVAEDPTLSEFMSTICDPKMNRKQKAIIKSVKNQTDT